MKQLWFLAVSLTSLWAQPGIPLPFPIPFRELEQYLQLTREQSDRIASNNQAFYRWSAERQQRSAQVALEIEQETKASPLDPGALGIRYAEVETIRREISEREKKLREDNLTVLNEAQKTRLKALEEAVKLMPVVGQARGLKLLEDECSFGPFPAPGLSRWFDISGCGGSVIRAPLPILSTGN